MGLETRHDLIQFIRFKEGVTLFKKIDFEKIDKECRTHRFELEILGMGGGAE